MEAQSSKLKAESEMKRCKSGASCVNGPDPQSIENFQKSGIVKGGRLGTCRDCMRKRISEGHQKGAIKRAGFVDPTVGIVQDGVELRPIPPIEAGPNILSLDFTGREELLSGLEKTAKENFRTIEQQALFYVFSGVSGGNWMPERKAD